MVHSQFHNQTDVLWLFQYDFCSFMVGLKYYFSFPFEMGIWSDSLAGWESHW